VEIETGSRAAFGYEITYFRQPQGRTILFLCANPETQGSEVGGGNAIGLKAGPLPIRLRFVRPVRKVRDEQSGRELGSGDRFNLVWQRNEAIVLSFEG
jgi:hypothetical protein